MATRGKETEIKLAVSSAAAVRRVLRRAGFRLRQPRSLERNVVFDTPNRRLRQTGCLLRLRSVTGRHWLTFKRPGGFSRHFKVRQEFETEVAQPAVLWELFRALGLPPVFRYEKYRTTYEGKGRWRGGEVMLDETPIGVFVELEGGRTWIRRMAQALFGARPARFITVNYAVLYADWCRHHRRRLGDMVFPSRRRALSA